ncbi:hypothetical protein Hanom_Chr14g01323941 [Helianthus anomalus]
MSAQKVGLPKSISRPHAPVNLSLGPNLALELQQSNAVEAESVIVFIKKATTIGKFQLRKLS